MSVTLPRIPSRIARLPVDERGYPVPWFVHWDNGRPEFRVIGEQKIDLAVLQKRCWICGEGLDRPMAFVLGPMSVVNGCCPEPPSHATCAEFAAKACPFLTQPKAKRREANLPLETASPAGVMFRHNPGACCVWLCDAYTIDGGLFRVGPSRGVSWYVEGRIASRAEVIAAIDRSANVLRTAVEATEDNALLESMIKRAKLLLPAA